MDGLAAPTGQAVPVASAILKGIGAPVNQPNIAAMVGWFNAEGGNWGNNAAYNPLNTTLDAAGARSVNGAGVKAYGNWNQGVQATVQTLRQPNMSGIVQAFRQSNPGAVARAIGASPWGTSAGTVAQTIGAATGQRFSVPSGAALPQSVGGVAGSTSVTIPTFNQAAYNKANDRYIAGSFLAHSESNSPWNFGPKGANLGPDPLRSAGLLTTQAPNIADYQGTKTLQEATAKLQNIAGTSLQNVHGGAQGYVNPIPGAVIGRTDMGVDATMQAGAPIRAIGNSKVVAIRPDWYQGQPYVQLQLLDGPQAGKNYYVAEQITPSVRPGQTVKAGQPIGTFAQSGTGIEIGWGSKGWQTEAQAEGNTGGSGHADSPAGQNFRSFLGALGA